MQIMTTELAQIGPDPLGDAPAKPARMPNPSWFKPGDSRINRKGRPRGTNAAKPLSGPLVRLVVPGQYITLRYIRGERGPHMDFLPQDVKIIDAHFDKERYAVVLTLWHPNFAQV